MKDIRIKVTTGDGLCTIWYERVKLNKLVSIDKAKENVCAKIQERVYNQLCGLNIKEIDVSVIGNTVTVWQVSLGGWPRPPSTLYWSSQPQTTLCGMKSWRCLVRSSISMIETWCPWTCRRISSRRIPWPGERTVKQVSTGGCNCPQPLPY